MSIQKQRNPLMSRKKLEMTGEIIKMKQTSVLEGLYKSQNLIRIPTNGQIIDNG